MDKKLGFVGRSKCPLFGVQNLTKKILALNQGSRDKDFIRPVNSEPSALLKICINFLIRSVIRTGPI